MLSRVTAMHFFVWASFGASAQTDTTGWFAWEQLMNTRLKEVYYRQLDACAVEVAWTPTDSSAQSVRVSTLDHAFLILGQEDLSLTSAERVLDFLDSASVLFHKENTPVRLLSGGYHASIRDYREEERKTGVVHVWSLMGCIRFGRQSDGVRVFNLRTDLLLDTLEQLSNESRMRALRMELSNVDVSSGRNCWGRWIEETIKLPNSCAQEVVRKRSRYVTKGHRWITQVEATELDCCGQPIKLKRYTENANAWNVRIEHYRERTWTSRCSLF